MWSPLTVEKVFLKTKKAETDTSAALKCFSGFSEQRLKGYLPLKGKTGGELGAEVAL